MGGSQAPASQPTGGSGAPPMALRLSGQLLLGVARLYNKKVCVDACMHTCVCVTVCVYARAVCMCAYVCAHLLWSLGCQLLLCVALAF